VDQVRAASTDARLRLEPHRPPRKRGSRAGRASGGPSPSWR
jgi:hypothetical protein